MKWTVLVMNSVLGTNHYCGTFDKLFSAESWAKGEASRKRKFIEFIVCEGTPANPGKLTDIRFKGAL